MYLSVEFVKFDNITQVAYTYNIVIIFQSLRLTPPRSNCG